MNKKTFDFTHLINSKFYIAFLALITLALLNLYCSSFSYNSDTLFPFRYANAISNSNNWALVVQPGPRYFPEWIYAFIIHYITSNAGFHLQLMMVLNSILLLFSLFRFCQTLIKQKKLSLIISCFALLLIPLMNLFYKSDIQYILFSPGIHGFLLPYIIFCLNFCLKIASKQSLNQFEYFLVFLTTFACTLSNQLFLVAYVAPSLSSLVILCWIIDKTVVTRNILNFFFITFFAVILAVLSEHYIKTLPNLHIQSLNNHLFTQSFTSWLNTKGATFFSNFYNPSRTGLISILVSISVVFSIVSLFINPIGKKDRTFIFLNLINIIWWPFIIFALWSINKGLIRYIPYVFLLSPVILLLNVYKYYSSHSRPIFNNFYMPIMLSIMLLILFISFPLNRKSFKIHDNSSFNGLMTQLKSLKDHGLITNIGLGSYWVAWSGSQDYGFKILPISGTGSPNLFASNAIDFWNVSEHSLSPYNFSFIVNRFNKNTQSWTLNKKKLQEKYGSIDRTLSYLDNRDRQFEIYLYSHISATVFYKEWEKVYNAYFPEFKPYTNLSK